MINRNTLLEGLSLLSTHFGKELQKPVLKIWAEYLTEELTEAEFNESVKNSLLHSRFMPTAGELVDFIQGGKEARAIADWQLVLAASTSREERSYEILAYATSRCRAALQAIGGIRAIALADSDFQRNTLQKQFILVYCQSTNKNQWTLPQATKAPQKSQEDMGEPTSMPSDVKEKLEALRAKFSL